MHFFTEGNKLSSFNEIQRRKFWGCVHWFQNSHKTYYQNLFYLFGLNSQEMWDGNTEGNGEPKKLAHTDGSKVKAKTGFSTLKLA